MIAASDRIREIDISRQARALRFLRFSDYLVFLLVGPLVLFLVHGFLLLVKNPESETEVLILGLVPIPILLFGMYSAWRNFGVIDPRIWRLHIFALPLIIFLLLDFWFVAEGFVYIHPELILLFLGVILGFVSVFRLRKMRIKSLGVRLVELLLNITSQGGLRAVDVIQIKRVNALFGIILLVFGWLILLVLVLVLILKPEFLMKDTLIGYRPYLLVSCFLWLKAKRYLEISADSLLAVDKRDPILFLRSFADDPKGTKGMASHSDKAWLDFSLEMRLSNHFSFTPIALAPRM